MKLKVYVVETDLSPRAKRLILKTCGFLAAALGSLAIAHAALPKQMWAANEILTAADLNSNFKAVDDRLTAVEAAQGKQVQVSAEITDTGTVVRQFSSAGWTLNPTRSAVGSYVLSFGGGVVLSAPPICTTAPLWGRNDFIRVGGDGAGTESTTSVSVRTASWSNGVPEDSGFTIVCFGTKM
jgi:hypothetical protein